MKRKTSEIAQKQSQGSQFFPSKKTEEIEQVFYAYATNR
jgi:hypothetical protein